MKQNSVILLFFLLLANKNICFAQSEADSIDISQFSSYKLIWDNDVMLQTDYYYTQGLAMELILPAFVKNPLNYIFVKPKKFTSLYGLSVHQETYTPTIIKTDNILYGDRPYAGALYVKSFLQTANAEKKLFIKSEFDIGFIGPYSFAGLTQYYFHIFSNNQLPLGWSNEINKTPIINYNLSINKGLLSNDYNELQGIAKARVGTLYDDLSVGLNYRVGLLNSFYETIGENMYVKNNAWQAYFSFNPQIKYVAHNATMQGNAFIRNSNAYIILPSQIEPLVYSVKTGVTLMYKNVGASFHFIWQTPEFDGGLHHTYHSFRFIYNF